MVRRAGLAMLVGPLLACGGADPLGACEVELSLAGFEVCAQTPESECQPDTLFSGLSRAEYKAYSSGKSCESLGYQGQCPNTPMKWSVKGDCPGQ